MRRSQGYELADPLDREARRGGMSADGLSYSVADDIGKLRGQALAEYDARRKDPRIDIWGDPLQEDTVSSLRAELFDPLGMGGGPAPAAPTSAKIPAPRTYKTKTADGGDAVIQVDPITGKSTTVYSSPGRPGVDYRDRADYGVAVDAIKTAQKTLAETSPQNAARYNAARSALNDAIAARDNLRSSQQDLQQPLPTPVEQLPTFSPQAPAPPTPKIFMGMPGVSNIAPSEAPGASRNGRLPLDLARQLLQRTKGDRELARKYALEMGYSVE